MTHFPGAGALAPILVALLLVTGCGTVEHKVDLDKQYTVQPGTKVVLGPIKNQMGQRFDIDVEKIGRCFPPGPEEKEPRVDRRHRPEAGAGADRRYRGVPERRRIQALAHARLGIDGSGGQGELYDANKRKIGSVDAKRTVDAGGGYTIGAWEFIFRNVADDIIAAEGTGEMIHTTAISRGARGRIMVQICRDAERFDLGRVGIISAPLRLCTAAAQERNMTERASRQRIGRRLYGFSRELS